MRTLVPLMLLLAGCASQMGAVWLVVMDPPEDLQRSVECTETLEDASCAVEDVGELPPGWVVTEETTGGQEAFFAQIVDSADDEKLLVAQDALFLGTEDDDGVWSFVMEDIESWTYDATHEASGYAFSASRDLVSSITIRLEFDGDVATGTMTQSYTQDEQYVETDTWSLDYEGAPYAGEIADRAYHLIDGYVGNYYSEIDCIGGSCEVAAQIIQSQQGAIEAHLTDLGHEAYCGIASAGANRD